MTKKEQNSPRCVGIFAITSSVNNTLFLLDTHNANSFMKLNPHLPNKLASLETTLVQDYDPPAQWHKIILIMQGCNFSHIHI